VLDPQLIVTFEAEASVGDGPVLVHALDGFVDAGHARRLAREHLLAASESTVVARFDADLLVDHRARRPPMLFAADHWESYAAPELVVRRLTDATGTAYLLLDGPEPDYQWERFLAAVRLVVERFRVRLAIGLNAIPMGVPHTRPIGLITHATRPELVGDAERWIDAVQVPGSIGNLLEFRLGQAGHDAMGFAVHVPHYLAQSEYPAAAVSLLDAVGRAGGLTFDLAPLRAAAAETAAAIDAQVAEAPAVAEVVRALEAQYDSFVAGRSRSLLAEGTELPTADELGAELERYLAEQSRRDGEGR
jgi:hypothetical protein